MSVEEKAILWLQLSFDDGQYERETNDEVSNALYNIKTNLYLKSFIVGII